MRISAAATSWWQPKLLLANGLLFLLSSLSWATDKVWTGGHDNQWSKNNNWSGNAPSASDNAKFNSTFSNQPTLNTNATVGGIWMTTGVGQNVTISATAGTLTLQGNTINGTAGLGILLDNTSAFALTISAPVQIGAAQSWMNSSGNLFTLSGTLNLNSNALTIDGTGNTTISGAISNAGAFTKAGTGTLTLSNTADSYTGQLTVQAGTLKIDTINNASANGELGNSALSVILGTIGGTGMLEYTGATASSTKNFTMASGGTGAFQIDSSGTSLTLSGVIDGSGSLLKTGPGTLILTGTNTYSGGSTISAGTLVVNSASSLGASSGALTINAGTLEVSTGFSTSRNVTLGDSASTFEVDASQTYTDTGVISGTGTLNKTGLGTMVLGANTYSGGTAVTAGTLQLGASGTFGSTGGALTVNAGTVDLNGQNATVGALSGIGGTILNNSSGSSTTLTIGQGNADGSYAGVIADHSSGTGTVALTKTGTGTETLTGVNTYTGATTINGGALFVNGSTAFGSAISVNNSGTTLGGSGTIGGSVHLASSGTNLSPGARGVGSIGILQTGSVTLSLGSNFNVDINGTTAGVSYDQLKVTGSVSITGSNLVITAGPSLSIGQTFFIVLNNGTDAITGTFAQGTTVMASNNLDVFSINYFANGDGGSVGNDISLTVIGLPEPGTLVPGILAVVLLIYLEGRTLFCFVSGKLLVFMSRSR
jgi:autotransporter-associated beta strand protein